MNQHRDGVIKHLNKHLEDGVELAHHLGGMALMVKGLPPEVTISVDDPEPSASFMVRLSHDGPDRYYGTYRSFKTIHALTLWLRYTIVRERKLVALYKKENPNWRRCV